MRTFAKAAAAAALLASTMGLPAYADNDKMDTNKFVTNCDADKDGMVSKAEVMKMVEKSFDKADKKKTGKLDKKQAEEFLKMLMQSGG